MVNIKIYIKQVDCNMLNISDYVIASDNIPVFENNKNGEPLISEFNFDYSDLLGILLVKKDRIYVAISDVVVFNGYVDSTVFDYNNRTHKVTVRSLLGLLQDNKLEYYNRNVEGWVDNAHSLGVMLQSTSVPNEFKLHDNQPFNPPINTMFLTTGFSNVSVPWVLKNIFLQCDLVLDTSDLIFKPVFTYDNINYTLHMILHDWESLFVIGQDKAINHYYIDNDTNLRDNSPSCFDYVQIICGIFGIDIVSTYYNTYKLMVRSNKSVFNTNIVYDKKDKVINETAYGSVTLDKKFDNRIEYYLNRNKQDLPFPLDGRGIFNSDLLHARNRSNAKTTIKWYNNLFFLLRLENTITGEVNIERGSIGLTEYSHVISKEFGLDIVFNEVINEIKTDVTTLDNYKILENKVDIKNLTSTIKTINWE